MKKCEMEWKSNAESVIGRLMGLDRLRLRQHLGKSRRVLSDGYKYKAAAIGVRNGSLISIGTKNVGVDAVKDVLGIVALVGKEDVRIMEHPSNASATKSLDGIQKTSEDYLVAGGQDELSKFGSEIVVKPLIIERELEKGTDGFTDRKFSVCMKSGYREINWAEKKLVMNDVRNCIGCARNMNRISHKLPSGNKFSELSIPGYMNDLSPNHTSPKTQGFGRWTRTKVVRRIEFSEGAKSGRRVDILEPQGGSGCNRFKTSLVGNNPIWESLNISDQDIEDEMNIGSYDKSLALINEFSEELSTYSNSSRIGTPEFPENPKRTDQRSPDSVLRPFYGQYCTSDQWFDGIGPQLQLQVLNLETEDLYSEGSLMDVSRDDDIKEQCADLPHHGRKVRTWLGDEESRNFSYMVDILDEAGFYSTKSCTDLKTWHSRECPISTSVFEALEEKYGKQTSWQKSDRRILFDYVNISLRGIFTPVMNLQPSLKRTLCANMRRDEVEDRLWTMLITVEKENGKVFSGKALEEWFEVEEGMDVIYNELATELFDELVAELVS